MEHEIVRMVWAQTWQVTLLILLVAALVRCVGRNHPHFAHALWVVVLLKALTPPVWSSPGGVFSWMQSPAETEEAVAEPPVVKPPTPSVPPVESGFPYELLSEADLDPDLISTALPPHLAPSELPAEWEPVVLDSFPAEADEPVAAESSPAPKPVSASSPWWKPLAIGLWLVGSLGSLSMACVRWLFCRREIRRAEQVPHPEAQRLLEQLRTRLGIRWSVGLIISKSRIGPAVLGVFRPTILIPSRVIEGKSPADLEPILAHELIHVRRGDLWVGWLQVVVQSVWWFHPLVWWSGRLLKLEAERCCDEEVVAELGCKPARYARALLDVLELKQILKPVPVLPGVKPVEITSRRLERIMLLRQGCRKRTPWWCWLAMLFTAALTLPGAAYVAVAKNKTEAQPASQPKEETLQTRTYKVGEALEKIQTDHQLNSKTEARRMLILHLKSMTQFLWDQESLLAKGEQIGTPSMFIKGNKLIVRHSPAVQREIEKQIGFVSQYGFREIRVETRFITVNPEVLERADVNWQPLPPEIPKAEQAGLDRPVLDGQEMERINQNQVKTLVEKSEPLKMALLTKSQSKNVLQICQGDARSNLMQCPTVTLFNGQSANVQDVVQRPFVVAVDHDGQSKIRVISEGISLKLRPTLDEGQIHLESQITASDIRSVSVMNLPTSDKQKAAGTKVQVPEVTTMRINVAVNLKAGNQVLLGGIKPPHESQRVLADGTKVKQRNEQLFVMLKVYPVDQDHIASPPAILKGEWEDSFAKAEAKADKSGLPILLHFRADWCGPCQQMDREVFAKTEFQKLLGSQIVGVKVDIDQNAQLAQRFNIQSIPANILISPDGKELKRTVGLMYAEPYVDWINRTVATHRPQGRLMLGAGVNSESGVTGAIVLDEKNFQPAAIDPPTDEEVLKALKKEIGPDVDRKKIRIVKEQVKESMDPARFYPMVGPARMHHVQFKCTVYYPKVVNSDWPVPFSHKTQMTAVTYIVRDHLIRVAEANPSKKSATPGVQPAAHIVDGVLYSPPGQEKPLAADAKAPSFAELVEKYNSLFNQRRYVEACLIGRRAKQAYPEKKVAELMYWKARFVLRDIKNYEEGLEKQGPIRPAKTDLLDRKTIEQNLEQKVSLKFEKTPMSEATKHIANQGSINIVVETNGLAEEGLLPEQPVSLDVENIKLSSALKLLLEPLRLGYIIEDEVLKITSKTRIETRQLLVNSYPVADLVVPIPNSVKVDLRGKTMKVVTDKPAGDEKPDQTWEGLVRSKDGKKTCDFDELIKLIESTVEPDSWDSKGGYGSIGSYETTLSLVIRHNTKTHEKIRSLLEQLRRLQDIQVTLAINTIANEDLIAPDLLKKLRAGQSVVMDPKQVAALKTKVTQNDESTVWNEAKITLFSGQVGDLLLPGSTKEGVGLRVLPIPSADRRFLRMQLETDSSNPKEKKQASLKTLKDGHSLLVEVNPGSESKKLVLITPHIIVQEEEEALLVLPPASKRVVRNKQGTQIIIQEEEEELLGIEPKK